MDEIWYYVLAGERKGPVEMSKLHELIQGKNLGPDDYIWKKGFENWVKIKDVEELELKDVVSPPVQNMPGIIESSSNSLTELANDSQNIFIKIGADRGGQETEYGPYTIGIIKKLFDEKRINAKTLIFVEGMKSWQFLADFDDFTHLFSDLPPTIKEEERRKNERKPFIARMYIQNQKEVYLGICRDISIGGMQVLVDHFPGSVGDKISINVHPENTNHHFVAAGSIVRLLDGGQGFSFRFTGLSDDSQNSINKYLQDAK